MNFLLRAVPFAALTLLAACETVQTTEAGAVGVTREQRVRRWSARRRSSSRPPRSTRR